MYGVFSLILPVDDLDSLIKPEHCTDAPAATNQPGPSDDVTGLEMKSSGTGTSQPPRDDSTVQSGYTALQTVGVTSNGNRLSDSSKNEVDSGQEMDDVGWNISAGQFAIPLTEGENRCIRCNKLRPPQQCPVCHLMYALVAIHINTHSSRKSHTPASLLESLPWSGDDTTTDQSRSLDQTHMCVYCSEIFPSAEELESHSESCLKFSICMVCGIMCGNEANLRSHIKTHMNVDAVKVPDEGSEQVLGNMKQENLRCAACEVDFDGVESLMLHMEEHMDEERRICRVCGKTFMNPDSLKSHMRSHTGKMHLQCEIPGKACEVQKGLEEHRAIDKPYVCMFCGEQFHLRKTFMKHWLIHEGDINS